jgi:hypothetical protein
MGPYVVHELREVIDGALDLLDVLVSLLYLAVCSTGIAISCRVQKLRTVPIFSNTFPNGREERGADSL